MDSEMLDFSNCKPNGVILVRYNGDRFGAFSIAGVRFSARDEQRFAHVSLRDYDMFMKLRPDITPVKIVDYGDGDVVKPYRFGAGD